MKKRSLLLVLVCLLLCMTLPTFVGCNGGKYVTFGSYPQTRVTDSALITTLTTAAGALPTAESSGAWTSYDYYIAGDNTVDYMWYIDLEQGGEKYRGVYFTLYRPQRTSFETRLEDIKLNNSYQDENGYLASTVYWFKFQPIKWRVLEEANGETLLLADMILDSREYSWAPEGWPEREETFSHNGGTGYANNYALSDIRKWLNDNFYNVAFSASEKQQIVLTAVDNGARSTNPDRNASEWNDGVNANACENTEDYVFLASAQEVTTKSYGFKRDPESTNGISLRKKSATDYALSQGIDLNRLGADGHGAWWLRSADFLNNHCARFVEGSGYAEGREVVDDLTCGVVPAVKIKRG